jgi:hypothetical protein
MVSTRMISSALAAAVTDLIGMPVATMTSGYAHYIWASNEHGPLP